MGRDGAGRGGLATRRHGLAKNGLLPKFGFPVWRDWGGSLKNPWRDGEGRYGGESSWVGSSQLGLSDGALI